MIELGPVASIAARDSGGEQRYRETELPQQGGKGSVHFVAEAATPSVDDLVDEGSFVTDDFAFKPDVKVFERDSEHMGTMEAAESRDVGFGGTGVRNAREISGSIQVLTLQNTLRPNAEMRALVGSATPATAPASTSLPASAQPSSQAPIFRVPDAC